MHYDVKIVWPQMTFMVESVGHKTCLILIEISSGYSRALKYNGSFFNRRMGCGRGCCIAAQQRL